MATLAGRKEKHIKRQVTLKNLKDVNKEDVSNALTEIRANEREKELKLQYQIAHGDFDEKGFEATKIPKGRGGGGSPLDAQALQNVNECYRPEFPKTSKWKWRCCMVG